MSERSIIKSREDSLSRLQSKNNLRAILADSVQPKIFKEPQVEKGDNPGQTPQLSLYRFPETGYVGAQNPIGESESEWADEVEIVRQETLEITPSLELGPEL